MNINFTAEETALLISALTTKISKLKEQSQLHRQEDMPHWAEDCDQEVGRCLALKERLFK